MQPVVTLSPDGQSGKARWHIMAMLGGYKGNASWAGGIYENSYVRENGVWKMQEVRYHAQYGGRYDAPGWTPTERTDAVPLRGLARRQADPRHSCGGRRECGRPATITDLGKRMADVAARAQRLSDEVEVTNLQHAYGYYLDRKMWDDVVDLFANDGTMEIGLQGVYVGPQSIRRGLGQAGLAEGELNDHVHLQTIVTLMPDGTARARGTDLGMTGAVGGKALWTQSIYENEYVKQGGVWKVKTMHLYPRFIVDAEQGWGRTHSRRRARARSFRRIVRPPRPTRSFRGSTSRRSTTTTR
jgi:hypothetical protein